MPELEINYLLFKYFRSFTVYLSRTAIWPCTDVKNNHTVQYVTMYVQHISQYSILVMVCRVYVQYSPAQTGYWFAWCSSENSL